MAKNTRRFAGAAIAGVALMLAGCASSSSEAPDPVGTWGATAEGMPQLVLASDGTVTGTDGCNGINTTWEEDGGTITFGPFASTMMACEGVDVWLSLAATATIDADAMDVQDVSGEAIGTLDKQTS
ncbi:META domain-containing protein [Demequina aurantiaca]|uniref:META domain-containing protein n=1 Tax=Demequina aurantiaca TaxID=676200 RepID=UPI003D3517CE